MVQSEITGFSAGKKELYTIHTIQTNLRLLLDCFPSGGSSSSSSPSLFGISVFVSGRLTGMLVA